MEKSRKTRKRIRKTEIVKIKPACFRPALMFFRAVSKRNGSSYSDNRKILTVFPLKNQCPEGDKENMCRKKAEKENRKKSICDLKLGEKGIIGKTELSGALKTRLIELGFTENEQIECVLVSPLGDPIAFRVCDLVMALRREDAEHILLKKAPFINETAEQMEKTEQTVNAEEDEKTEENKSAEQTENAEQTVKPEENEKKEQTEKAKEKGKKEKNDENIGTGTERENKENEISGIDGNENTENCPEYRSNAEKIPSEMPASGTVPSEMPASGTVPPEMPAVGTAIPEKPDTETVPPENPDPGIFRNTENNMEQ